MGREALCHLLRIGLACGREKHRVWLCGRLRSNVSNRLKYGSRFHQHTLAAAKRRVIYAVMTIMGPFAQIMCRKVKNTCFLGATHNGRIKIWGKNLREDRQYVKMHHASSPFFSSTKPAGTSTYRAPAEGTSRIYAPTTGMRMSFFVPLTTHTSCAGVKSTSESVPRSPK